MGTSNSSVLHCLSWVGKPLSEAGSLLSWQKLLAWFRTRKHWDFSLLLPLPPTPSKKHLSAQGGQQTLLILFFLFRWLQWPVLVDDVSTEPKEASLRSSHLQFCGLSRGELEQIQLIPTMWDTLFTGFLHALYMRSQLGVCFTNNLSSRAKFCIWDLRSGWGNLTE